MGFTVACDLMVKLWGNNYGSSVVLYAEPGGAAGGAVIFTLRPSIARCKPEQLRDTAKLNVHAAVCDFCVVQVALFKIVWYGSLMVEIAGTWIMFWRVRGRR